MASWSNIFLLFGAIFKCGRIIYWFLTSGFSFVKSCLGANFMVFGRSSLLFFICQVIWGVFENFVL